MEPYTLNRNFLKQDIVDGFESIIWTERYYGNGEVELVVPLTSENIRKFPAGTFLGLDGSNEIMILETVNPEENLTLTGISLLQWMNNRFVRTTANHEDRYWYIEGDSAGWILWAIIWSMCAADSPYLNGTIDIGITNPEQLAIPGLGLIDFDISGESVKVGVPYGPVYDAMKEIATTFEIGMQLLLVSATSAEYALGFRSYKGLDRTSGQSENSVVRFSPEMDSFTDIKELQSIAELKTLVYTFAPGLNPAEGDPDLRTVPGVSARTGQQYTGFDLRALQVFAEDITTDQIAGDSDILVDILNSRAYDALTDNSLIQTVDGEIVPDNQFKYGTHYNLGDLIEVEGNSGVVQTARITEYIRSHDKSGERAYPTVSMIG